MAPSSEELQNIAAQAEQDLNSYSAKTGSSRSQGVTTVESGVNSEVEKKFPGATVAYPPDISTNAGYNRRIPPEEGGELDDRGRHTRGSQFEGVGGPEDKLAQAQDERGGYNDSDVPPRSTIGRSETETKEHRGQDALAQGLDAKEANVGRNPPGVGGGSFKGEDYYTPEDVPDSIATEGNVPPDSVIQASKESEGY